MLHALTFFFGLDQNPSWNGISGFPTASCFRWVTYTPTDSRQGDKEGGGECSILLFFQVASDARGRENEKRVPGQRQGAGKGIEQRFSEIV